MVQTLFICSGCDYVSFFAGFGKVTIMRHFFENAWFITGTQDIPGTLADTPPDRVEEGFNQLQLALAGDPDLALVPPGLRACVVQTLFICSGCDYVSFFAGFGKVTIMRHFFENAWFITGTQDIPGTLADTPPDRVEEGFMSFVRLIGTIYFKKTPCSVHCEYSTCFVHVTYTE